MQGTYSLSLVALSLVIAMFASYTVLDLTGFITFLERPALKHAWLVGGAIAMGVGIWSMHFVGMLAFSLPIPLGYDLRITIASLAIAMLVSYFALNVVVRDELSNSRLWIGGVLMGFGIAGMHYTGMAAMRMEPGISFDPLLVILSLAVAIAASTAALWIAHTLSAKKQKHIVAKRIGASAIMGIAIAGMHYIGMGAADFVPGAICAAARGTNMQWLAVTVSASTLIILLLTLMVSRIDARMTFLRGMTQTLEEQMRRRTGELEEHKEATDALHASREKMAQELAERTEAQKRLEQETETQRKWIDELKGTHAQLIQSAKSASIGQLAASVSQEINDPLNMINTSLDKLKGRVQRLLEIVSEQESIIEKLDASAKEHLLSVWKDYDIARVRVEINSLIDDSINGALRIRIVSEDLNDFARSDREVGTHA